jgi:adenylyltransferase/sulfurtransferase
MTLIAPNFARYARQMLLPQVGTAGQALLAKSRVLLVGCGALGCHLADQIVRAGIGYVRLCDRDVVELTNLQRQSLFDEQDAKAGIPKAHAAAKRLAAINSTIVIEPAVVDVWSGNAEELALINGKPVDLILDGTDNVLTRYLLNDLAVKLNIPWVYAACIGTQARMMAIHPAHGACLRCVFPTPPAGNELPTCDTAGVLQAAAAVAASLQATAAIKILTGQWKGSDQRLWTMDLWSNRTSSLDLQDAKEPDCPCCGKRNFEFLHGQPGELAIALCGRNAIQIRPPHPWQPPDFERAISRLKDAGRTEGNLFFSRCRLDDPPGIMITCFKDGRLVVDGTSDAGRAKSICARYIGT